MFSKCLLGRFNPWSGARSDAAKEKINKQINTCKVTFILKWAQMEQGFTKNKKRERERHMLLVLYSSAHTKSLGASSRIILIGDLSFGFSWLDAIKYLFSTLYTSKQHKLASMCTFSTGEGYEDMTILGINLSSWQFHFSCILISVFSNID